MKYPNFLFSYDNLNFWQVDKSTIEYNYNDGLFHDSCNEDLSLKIKYLCDEGFFDGIGKRKRDDEFGEIITFSININQERFLDKS